MFCCKQEAQSYFKQENDCCRLIYKTLMSQIHLRVNVSLDQTELCTEELWLLTPMIFICNLCCDWLFQTELLECQSRLRDLEAELQRANNQAYNAEHQLTQLSLKVRTSPIA